MPADVDGTWLVARAGLETAFPAPDSAAAPLGLEGTVAQPEGTGLSSIHGNPRHTFPGLADVDGPSSKLLTVHSLDGSLGVCITGKLDEGKTPRPPCGTVQRQNHIANSPDGSEQLKQIIAGCIEAQVPDKDFP